MSISALLFSQSFSPDLWTQSTVNTIHPMEMASICLHYSIIWCPIRARSVNDLPKVANSPNNIEYSIEYDKFYQGRIDSSITEGPFCSLQQALGNGFSDSESLLIVLDGYMMAGIKKANAFYLFDSQDRNNPKNKCSKNSTQYRGSISLLYENS